MGSSKKSKDKDRKKEEKKKKRHRERSRSRDPEKEHKHKHRHKHKKHRSKRLKEDPTLSPPEKERSFSGSLSDITISDDEILLQKDPRFEAPSPPRMGKRVPSPPRISKRAPSPPRMSRRPASPSRGMRIPPSRSPPRHYKNESSPPPSNQNSSSDASLSIAETNKIREKLGLKPLEITSEVPKLPPMDDDDDDDCIETNPSSELKKDSYGEFLHKPAENIRDKLQVEKLREKIAAQREKRKQKEKLAKIKSLGASDEEDDDALSWINKSRKIAKEKLEAEKKDKMLAELDAQFGIGDLVEEEIYQHKKKAYTGGSLSGLKVDHDMTRFDNGNTTILTLKDSNILDGDEDALMNVNIRDSERFERNVQRKKKKLDQLDYDAPEVDEFGKIVQNNVLTKYDEEISGMKSSSFRLGSQGEAIRGNDAPIRKMSKLKQLQSLELPQSQLASEYMTETEMVSFKKVKKKKKKKKMLTADDLEPIEDGNDHFTGSRHNRVINSRTVDTGNGDVVQDSTFGRVKSLRELMEEDEEDVKMEVDAPPPPPPEENYHNSDIENDSIELQEALTRTRRAKTNQIKLPSTDQISEFIKMNKPSPVKSKGIEFNDELMTLNTTDEFCRTLGDIPTYGLSGNREEDAALLHLSPQKKGGESEATGAWEEVDIEDTRVEISDNMTQPILEEEPDASKGVSNALKLAIKKGYLEKDNSKKAANAALQHLRAVHYSIEDKAMEDERRGRGDRYMGPTSDFKEKDNYKPDVKLQYVDDEGRKLCSKEAFRYLSHKFHGKGSGKNKLEKRRKKWQEELLMKHMSSSDTPLQTLERQREKQRQLGSAYIVLSGHKTQEAMDVKK